MRFVRVVAGIVAATFVFGPALLWVVGVRPQSIENRPLAKAPSLEHGWDGVDAAGPWASDHLPGRVNAVRANSWISYFVLHELPQSTTTTTNSPASVNAGRNRPVTPNVIRGKDGYLFYGDDFDAACNNGKRFRKSLRGLAKLAQVIESSGRKAVFTVGPNKSSVTTEELPQALPRGECAREGITSQSAVLDDTDDPRFVNTRRLLVREHEAGRQVYWKTDTHWNTAGGAVVAKELARHFSPDLADRLRVQPTTLTKTGDLMELAGLTFKEKVRSADVDAGGEVVERSASTTFHPRRPRYGVNRWDTTPSAGLVQGRSLVIGDSFSYFVLSVVRPLFAHGTFMWTGRVPEQAIVDEIAESDTVVLEVVQRSLVGKNLASKAFRAKVAERLDVADVP